MLGPSFKKTLSGAIAGAFLLLALPQGRAEEGFSARLSGFLGQSQPEGFIPLSSLGVSGVIQATDSSLWFGSGNSIFKAVKGTDGSWGASEVFKLESQARSICFDGLNAFILCSDNSIQRFNPLSPEGHGLLLKLDFRPRSFAIAPLRSEGKGFGKLAKGFVLKDDIVYAWKADAPKLATLLNLPKPEKGNWEALGLDPETGDLLLSIGYPGGIVRRFSPSGEIVNAIWPLPASASVISTTPEGAWFGHGLFGFLPAPKASGILLKPKEGFVHNYWTNEASGATKLSDGTLCVASAQGLVFLPPEGVPSRRIGGMEPVSMMSISPEGELVAYAGGRFIRLAVDGSPFSPLLCNSHEPWRAANGYAGKALSIAWDRGGFLVLDASSDAVWSFDPKHTAWAEEPWRKLSSPKDLSKPSSLAVGDLLYWVLDDGRLLEFQRLEASSPKALGPLQDLDLSKAKAISAATDKLLFIAEPKALSALAIDSKGGYKIAWRNDMSEFPTSALSADIDAVATLSRSTGHIEVLDAATGARLVSFGPSCVPGGFEPSAISLRWPWLYAYDDFGKRIVRFKIEKERK